MVGAVTAATRTPPRSAIGPLLREWRTRRRRSQLDLAVEVGMSTRHLSFVETGRSRPSPELVLAIATHLDVPLRERNTLLLAAGYAPRYSQSSFDDPSMVHARASPSGSRRWRRCWCLPGSARRAPTPASAPISV